MKVKCVNLFFSITVLVCYLKERCVYWQQLRAPGKAWQCPILLEQTTSPWGRYWDGESEREREKWQLSSGTTAVSCPIWHFTAWNLWGEWRVLCELLLLECSMKNERSCSKFLHKTNIISFNSQIKQKIFLTLMYIMVKKLTILEVNSSWNIHEWKYYNQKNGLVHIWWQQNEWFLPLNIFPFLEWMTT